MGNSQVKSQNQFCTLAVSTGNGVSVYNAGDVIFGTVYMQVQKEGFQIAVLDVAATGEEHAWVTWTETHGSGENQHTVTRYADEGRCVLDQKVSLATFDTPEFGSRCPNGQWEYPFSIQLPSDIPASMHAFNTANDRCSVEYMLRASIFESRKSKKPALVSNFNFCVRQKVLFIPRAPVMTPVCTRSISSCCCIHRGFMCLQAQVHEPTVCPYQPLHLSVDAHNESTKQATNIYVKLEEVVKWKVRGHRGSKKIYIGSVDLDPTRVSNMERIEKVHRRASRKSAQAQAAEITSSTINSGSGVLITFPVNTDNVSYNGSMITVAHTVKAKIKTARCVTDPKISYPITVANCAYTNSDSARVANDVGTGRPLPQQCVQQMYTSPVGPNTVYPLSLPVGGAPPGEQATVEQPPPPSYQMVRDLLPPDWNGCVAPPVAYESKASVDREGAAASVSPTANAAPSSPPDFSHVQHNGKAAPSAPQIPDEGLSSFEKPARESKSKSSVV
eukprot:m.747018 g.747018  ORF g.747018 m.747018 type:complete len:502 (+) comp23142_c0_seq3:282-1787(+)